MKKIFIFLLLISLFTLNIRAVEDTDIKDDDVSEVGKTENDEDDKDLTIDSSFAKEDEMLSGLRSQNEGVKEEGKYYLKYLTLASSFRYHEGAWNDPIYNAFMVIVLFIFTIFSIVTNIVAIIVLFLFNLIYGGFLTNIIDTISSFIRNMMINVQEGNVFAFGLQLLLIIGIFGFFVGLFKNIRSFSFKKAILGVLGVILGVQVYALGIQNIESVTRGITDYTNDLLAMITQNEITDFEVSIKDDISNILVFDPYAYQYYGVGSVLQIKTDKELFNKAILDSYDEPCKIEISGLENPLCSFYKLNEDLFNTNRDEFYARFRFEYLLKSNEGAKLESKFLENSNIMNKENYLGITLTQNFNAIFYRLIIGLFMSIFLFPLLVFGLVFMLITSLKWISGLFLIFIDFYKRFTDVTHATNRSMIQVIFDYFISVVTWVIVNYLYIIFFSSIIYLVRMLLSSLILSSPFYAWIFVIVMAIASILIIKNFGKVFKFFKDKVLATAMKMTKDNLMSNQNGLKYTYDNAIKPAYESMQNTVSNTYNKTANIINEKIDNNVGENALKKYYRKGGSYELFDEQQKQNYSNLSQEDDLYSIQKRLSHHEKVKETLDNNDNYKQRDINNILKKMALNEEIKELEKNDPYFKGKPYDINKYLKNEKDLKYFEMLYQNQIAIEQEKEKLNKYYQQKQEHESTLKNHATKLSNYDLFNRYSSEDELIGIEKLEYLRQKNEIMNNGFESLYNDRFDELKDIAKYNVELDKAKQKDSTLNLESKSYGNLSNEKVKALEELVKTESLYNDLSKKAKDDFDKVMNRLKTKEDELNNLFNEQFKPIKEKYETSDESLKQELVETAKQLKIKSIEEIKETYEQAYEKMLQENFTKETRERKDIEDIVKKSEGKELIMKRDEFKKQYESYLKKVNK